MIRGENGEYEEKREIFRIVVFSMNEENFFLAFLCYNEVLKGTLV